LERARFWVATLQCRVRGGFHRETLIKLEGREVGERGDVSVYLASNLQESNHRSMTEKSHRKFLKVQAN